LRRNHPRKQAFHARNNLAGLSFIVVLIGLFAAGCSPRSTPTATPAAFADKNARMYQMYFDSSADPAVNELQARRFMGHIRMADLEALIGENGTLVRDESCRFLGGPVLDEVGRTWYATQSPDLVGANLVSISPDGTKSSAFDLDGDRMVDILDIQLPDGRRASVIAEAVGLDPFLEWLKGNDPFCNADLMKGLDLPDLACTDTGGSAGGSGSGAASAGFADPADSICAGYSGGPASSFLANSPTQSWSVGVGEVTTWRSPDGALRIEESTDYFDARTGEFEGTNKYITEYNPSNDSLVEIHESVSYRGYGTRTITVTESDGTRTTRTETFRVARDDAGQPGYDEALASPASPGAPTEEEEAEQEREENESAGTETDATQGEPGPEGDDSVIAEFCARRENYLSGVEQAVQHDPSAISISCGDLVGAPTPNCKILEWARPEDWRTILEPPSDNSCDAFDDPEKQCEGSGVEDRIRKFLGETAELWSLDTPDITLCSPLACDPANQAALRSYTSGEANIACPAVAEAPVATDTPAVDLRCDLLKGMDVGLVTLDWQPGQPLSFYNRMPGGVPGLEKAIEGDDDLVQYSARWGDYRTEACKFIPGYPERLYCDIQLPSEYGGSLRPFELYVSGCEQPIFSNARAEVPGYVGQAQPAGPGPGGGQGGVCTLTNASCALQGLVLDSANCQCIVFQ
jgi:hypothetical protein